MQCDLHCSDMAPNASGVKALDQECIFVSVDIGFAKTSHLVIYMY